MDRLGLNSEQEAGAGHYRGRALVLAGPGSGKTSTITARIGRLLGKGVLPANILCITFTNKAAQEMRQRMLKHYGAAGRKITICTFHALAGTLLRQHGRVLGYTPKMTILDSEDQENLMAQVARMKYADDASVDFTRPKIRKLVAICNEWRENLAPRAVLEEKVDDGDLSDAELAVIEGYLSRMRSNNQTDFSGLLSEAARLLRHVDETMSAEEQVSTRLQRQFQFIQVDEYQDTNVAQNEIVELLAGPSDNVLAVGDQDQSIYEWRGASPAAVSAFVNRGRGKGGCQTYHLATNYRSTPEIIALADRLIRHGPGRAELEFTAARPSIGRPPRLQRFFNPEQEAFNIAEKIKAFVTAGVAPAQIAAFYRLNDMSRPLEQQLARRQVPYKVVGGLSFYDRGEIRDCIAMLRLLSNPRDSAAFARIANKPKRGIGEKTIGLIENYAAAREMTLIESCRHAHEYLPDRDVIQAVQSLSVAYGFPTRGRGAAECLAECVERGSYMKHLQSHEKEAPAQIEERQRNVTELITSIDGYCQENQGATMESYLQYVALLTSLDDKKSDEGVRLMSLHASKGLEFDIVFMLGVENNLLPHKKAVDERPDSGLNEERRLCYVGMTRAKKQLFLSYCAERQDGFARGKTKTLACRPSVFLLESGLLGEMEYLAKPAATLVS